MIVHARFSGFLPVNWSATDILRIEDRLLVEHWDVIQDEATQEGSKSGLRAKLRCSGRVSRYIPTTNSHDESAGACLDGELVLERWPKGLQPDPPAAAVSSQFQADLPPWVIWRM